MTDTLLLAGASGFLGSRLAAIAAARGLHVVGLTREPVRSDATFDLVTTDWSSEDLGRIVDAVAPRYVVHLVGEYHYSHSRDVFDALLDANLTAALKLGNAAHTAEVIVLSGSYFESFAQASGAPVNVYSALKQAAASLVSHIADLSPRSPRVAEIRLGDVYGPDDRRRKLIPVLVSAALSGASVEVDSRARLRPLHVDDAATALLHALREPSAIGSRSLPLNEVSAAELVRVVERLTGQPILATEPQITRPHVIERDAPPRLAGWEPAWQLERGISTVVEAARV